MANQFLESIKASLYNLKTLEIVTAVGSVQYPSTPPKADELHLPDLDTSKPYASMLTKIDLLEGDVTTVMNEQFATGDYTSLRAFHQAREEQGHQIIVNNINAIKELLNLALRPELQDLEEDATAATTTTTTGGTTTTNTGNTTK